MNMSQLKAYEVFVVSKNQFFEKYRANANGNKERQERFDSIVNRLVQDGHAKNITHAKKFVTWKTV